MPLIVPRNKEEIGEFLADGNAASVPYMQTSDIGDAELLSGTRTIEEGGGYKFAITLPSGRVLESAPVGSDYPKRDAIMQWLGAVRESIVEDAANASRAARDAHMAESRARDLASTNQSQAGLGLMAATAPAIQPSADPVEYAKSQLRAAVERLANLASAEAEVAKWQRVVGSLTGDVPKKRKKRRKKKVNVIS